MSNSAINFVPKRSHLDFWIKNNLNVLFIGKHGVGKTSLILDAFQGNNLRYKYFSASTMDPWVDFIGVPRSMEDDKGPYYQNSGKKCRIALRSSPIPKPYLPLGL